MKLLHLLGLTILPLLSCAQNPSTDKQRCYSGAGQLAPDYIIPCYTSWTAEATFCCKRGNVCLDHNACYDSGTGVTYQYGCTDEKYQDANCPKKCNLDTKKSSWTGLVYCGNAAGNPNNTWLCHQPDSCGDKCPDHTPWDPQLEKLPKIECDDIDGKNKAFEGPWTLSDLMRLPHDATGLASYFSAHPTANPSQVSSASVATTAASTGRTTDTGSVNSTPASTGQQSDPASPTPRPTDSSPPQDSNSSSKTTAFAAGFGAGLPIVLALTGALVFLLRRRRAKGTPATPVEDEPVIRTFSNSPSSPEAGYSHKAELPGESKPMYEAVGSPAPTELDGSAADGYSPWGSPVQVPIGLGMTSKYNSDGTNAVEIQSNELHELPG